MIDSCDLTMTYPVSVLHIQIKVCKLFFIYPLFLSSVRLVYRSIFSRFLRECAPT